MELGINTLRRLQGLEGGIRLSQPQQYGATPGESLGVVGIDGKSAVDLCLCFTVLLTKKVDVAENYAGAHFGLVKAERFDSQFLGPCQKGDWRLRPAH